MFRLTVLALLAVCAFPLLAGQAPGPTVTTKQSPNEPLPRKEDLTSEEILKEYVRRAKEGKNVNVDPAQAALCPVCNQPFHKHADTDFVCEPPIEIDPETNKPVRTVQRIARVTVPCPVCKVSFRAAKQGNINDQAGRDRDFCPHSVGLYAIHTSVWMCPECGYAADADSYGRAEPAKPELIQFVQSKLTPKTRELIEKLARLKEVEGKPIRPEQLRFSEYIEQQMIPDWVKYENALAIVEAGLIALPHGVKARLYCEAAHACRRFVASELGVSLEDQRLQISLGQSARRVNDWLLAECLKVREDRMDGKQDPDADLARRLAAYSQKSETDPQILKQGAECLGRKMEEILRMESQENDPTKPTRITRLDQYVFHTRFAGILDRIGDLDGTVAQLEKALAVVPKDLPSVAGPLEADAKTFIERLTNSLKNAVTERTELVRKERQLLFNAANHLMQALYFGEKAKNLDPAMNCYLIGELLRRSEGEPAAALAFFQAAKQLFAKIDPQQIKPEIPVGTPIETAQKMTDRAQQNAQKKRDVMLAWSEAQMALVSAKAAGREPDQRVRDTVGRILSGRIGEPAISAAEPDIRIPETTTKTPTEQPKGPAEQPKVATVPPAKGLTREAVLKSYYAAFKAYEKQNGAVPEKLSELVTAGMLKQDQACQDDQGLLVCPETGLKLVYFKPASLGAHSPIIFPGGKDTNRLRLFADGQVGEK